MFVKSIRRETKKHNIRNFIYKMKKSGYVWDLNQDPMSRPSPEVFLPIPVENLPEVMDLNPHRDPLNEGEDGQLVVRLDRAERLADGYPQRWYTDMRRPGRDTQVQGGVIVSLPRGTTIGFLENGDDLDEGPEEWWDSTNPIFWQDDTGRGMASKYVRPSVSGPIEATIERIVRPQVNQLLLASRDELRGVMQGTQEWLFRLATHQLQEELQGRVIGLMSSKDSRVPVLVRVEEIAPKRYPRLDGLDALHEMGYEPPKDPSPEEAEAIKDLGIQAIRVRFIPIFGKLDPKAKKLLKFPQGDFVFKVLEDQEIARLLEDNPSLDLSDPETFSADLNLRVYGGEGGWNRSPRVAMDRFGWGKPGKVNPGRNVIVAARKSLPVGTVATDDETKRIYRSSTFRTFVPQHVEAVRRYEVSDNLPEGILPVQIVTTKSIRVSRPLDVDRATLLNINAGHTIAKVRPKGGRTGMFRMRLEEESQRGGLGTPVELVEVTDWEKYRDHPDLSRSDIKMLERIPDQVSLYLLRKVPRRRGETEE